MDNRKEIENTRIDDLQWIKYRFERLEEILFPYHYHGYANDNHGNTDMPCLMITPFQLIKEGTGHRC